MHRLRDTVLEEYTLLYTLLWPYAVSIAVALEYKDLKMQCRMKRSRTIVI